MNSRWQKDWSSKLFATGYPVPDLLLYKLYIGDWCSWVLINGDSQHASGEELSNDNVIEYQGHSCVGDGNLLAGTFVLRMVFSIYQPMDYKWLHAVTDCFICWGVMNRAEDVQWMPFYDLRMEGNNWWINLMSMHPFGTGSSTSPSIEHNLYQLAKTLPPWKPSAQGHLKDVCSAPHSLILYQWLCSWTLFQLHL